MSSATESAALYVPAGAGLDELAVAARSCRGCELSARGTQTVFGEGATTARIVLVGEQPGDKEDIEGRRFVGPAGHLLDRCLEDAGIDRADVYVTNAVKHFKWEPRGKRRIHSKPNAREIRACLPWLEAELEQVEPEALVCLGATAAQAVFGSAFKLSDHRGEFLSSRWAERTLATIHPSAVLRVGEDDVRRRAMRESLTDDLRLVREAIQ